MPTPPPISGMIPSYSKEPLDESSVSLWLLLPLCTDSNVSTSDTISSPSAPPPMRRQRKEETRKCDQDLGLAICCLKSASLSIRISSFSSGALPEMAIHEVPHS